MTKITYIHGIPQDELVQRAAEIPQAGTIDYRFLSEGELSATLLLRQLRVLANYYPELSDYRRAEQLVANALQRGLHQNILPTGGSDMVRAVAKKLNQLSRKISPSINGGYQLSGLTDELITAIIEGRSIDLNSFDNVLEKCAELYEKAHQTTVNLNRFGDKVKVLEYCNATVNNIVAMNDHLGDGAYHLLYEFATSPQDETVRIKRVLHRNAASSLSGITHISRDNMVAWLRVGVMEANAKNGTEPFQPEQTYQTLQWGWSRGDNTGINEPLTAAALGAIISAIGGAIMAVDRLLRSLAHQEKLRLQSTANGIGSKEFGPEETDFSDLSGSGTANPLDNNSNLIMPLLLGGAGLLLLTNN